MIDIQFYGPMRKKYGKGRRLAIKSPAEMSRAFAATMPGWREFCLKHDFKIVVGETPITEEQLGDPVGCAETIRLVPVVAGAKDEMWQAVSGAVLFAVGTYLKQPWLQSIGLSMMLGGVAQMLAGTPPGMFEPGANSDLETFGFNNPTLTTGQGGCVPLGYGRMRVGGHVISAGIDAQTWQAGGFGGKATTEDGTRYGDGALEPWVWAIAPV